MTVSIAGSLLSSNNHAIQGTRRSYWAEPWRRSRGNRPSGKKHLPKTTNSEINRMIPHRRHSAVWFMCNVFGLCWGFLATSTFMYCWEVIEASTQKKYPRGGGRYKELLINSFSKLHARKAAKNNLAEIFPKKTAKLTELPNCHFDYRTRNHGAKWNEGRNRYRLRG